MKLKWQLMKKSVRKKKIKDESDDNENYKQSHLILIFALSTLTFSSNIDGDFVFDDLVAVANNAALNNVSQIIITDYWGHPIRSSQSHKSYRPITSITFAINRFISGQRTISYHLTNILLHSAVTIMIYEVTGKLIRFFDDVISEEKVSKNVALYTALLFAVHPVHSEAVANIVGRAELLMSLTFFLLLDNYLEGMQMGFSHRKTFFICLFSILSLFSKEQGIIALPSCAVVEVILAIHTRNKNKVRLLAVVSRLFLCSIFTMVLIVFRLYINGFVSPKFSELDNPVPYLTSNLIKVINYWYLFLLNIWLLIYPIHLCFDYSMGCIVLIENFNDIRIYSLLFALLIAVVVILHWIYLFHRNKLKILAISLFAIAYLPASNIFISVGFIIAERVLYLPSYGFCFLCAILYEYFCQKLDEINIKELSHFTAGLILFVACLKSLHRAAEWKSEYNLYKSGLSVCPKNAKILYNLGKISAKHGNTEGAELYYRSAIKYEPRFSYALNNLANIYLRKGRSEEAEELLRKSVELEPTFATAWMNLGISLLNRGKFQEAEESFYNGLRLRQNYADCLYNLGLLYSQQGKTNLAEQLWKNVTQIEPTHQLAWTNLLVLLEETDRCFEALEIGRNITRHFPINPSIHMQMGICYGKLSEYERSEYHLLIAIQVLPKSAKCWTNLGVLYEKWGKVEKAVESYKKAVENEFHTQKAAIYLKNLNKKRK